MIKIEGNVVYDERVALDLSFAESMHKTLGLNKIFERMLKVFIESKKRKAK